MVSPDPDGPLTRTRFDPTRRLSIKPSRSSAVRCGLPWPSRSRSASPFPPYALGVVGPRLRPGACVGAWAAAAENASVAAYPMVSGAVRKGTVTTAAANADNIAMRRRQSWAGRLRSAGKAGTGGREGGPADRAYRLRIRRLGLVLGLGGPSGIEQQPVVLRPLDVVVEPRVTQVGRDPPGRKSRRSDSFLTERCTQSQILDEVVRPLDKPLHRIFNTRALLPNGGAIAGRSPTEPQGSCAKDGHPPDQGSQLGHADSSPKSAPNRVVHC